MECNIIRIWINELLDNEVDSNRKMKILKHIEKCSECKEYYRKTLEIHEEIRDIFQCENYENYIEENIIKSIHNIEFKPKKKRLFNNMRIAICVVVIMILLIVPFNGKSAFAQINEWVKSLTVKNERSELTIDYDPTLSIEEDEEIKPPNNIIREKYKSLEKVQQVLKDLTYKQCYIPQNIADDYIFKEATLTKQDELCRLFVNLTYTNEKDSISEKQILLDILNYNPNLKEQDVIESKLVHVDSKVSYDHEIEAKEIEVAGIKGILIKHYYDDWDEKQPIPMDASFLFVDYGYEIEIKGSDENEIIKISKSFIEQIKENTDIEDIEK